MTQIEKAEWRLKLKAKGTQLSYLIIIFGMTTPCGALEGQEIREIIREVS